MDCILLQKINHVFCIFSSSCNRRTSSSFKCNNQHHWWPGRLRCCSHGEWSVSKHISTELTNSVFEPTSVPGFSLTCPYRARWKWEWGWSMSVECCYNHNNRHGRTWKEEGRQIKWREIPFSLSLFSPLPLPLHFMSLPQRIYGYIL